MKRLLLLATAMAVGLPLAVQAAHPDLSGFWNPMQQIDPDPVLSKFVPAGTAEMRDAGSAEFGLMEFGGLKPRPAALAKARAWDPRQDMTVSNACRVPSIVYSMQGPFPIEIFQGTELIALRMEYFDVTRLFLIGAPEWPAKAPHTKAGYSRAHWEGDVLVVITTHLKESTITNNGLDHSESMRVTERYRLADAGRMLVMSQEYDDPEVLENRGVRYIGFRRAAGDHVHAYDCDPSFAESYAKP